MSGHLLFKKLLQEKERAAVRAHLRDACTSVATSFCLTAGCYSALTYLASQLPAQSRDHEASAALTMDAAAAAMRNRANSGLNDPESGVQLLIAIFKRVGGEQIAAGLEKKQLLASNNLPNRDWFNMQDREKNENLSLNKSESSFSKGLSQHVTPDPALSIRPQLAKREEAAVPAGTASGAITYSQNFNGSNNGSAQNLQSKLVSEKPYIREWSNNSRRQLQNADSSQLVTDHRQVALNEPASAPSQSVSEHAAERGTDAVTGIIRPSEQPGLFKYVREYMKEGTPPVPPAAQNNNGFNSIAGGGGGAAGKDQILAQAPAAAPQGNFSAIPARSLAQSPPARSLPIPAPNEEERDFLAASTNAAKFKALKKSSNAKFARLHEEGGKGNLAANTWYKSAQQMQILDDAPRAMDKRTIAFLPPNAVHGITGLPLGSSTSETMAFFKNRGKVSMVPIGSFSVYTLKDAQGLPLLQAFLREGSLEALRIFHPTYTPPQLGLNLGVDLPELKAKFGEPAFILEEPRNRSKAAAAPAVMAKNYCYPISQVSFQLARQSSSAAPQVMSLFIFRFL